MTPSYLPAMSLRYRSARSLWVIWLLGLFFAVTACDDALGVELRYQEKSVRRGTSPVWVEYENDSVTVPPQQLKREDYSDRHDSIFQDSGSSWGRWLESFFGGGTGNSGLTNFFSWISEIWRILVLILLAILVGTLLFFVFRSDTFQAWISRRSDQFVEEDLEQQRAKVSDLPFEIDQPLLGLRAQAERFRNLGDYSQAMVYLYSYLLVELDHANCIRLERGKTNGVYMRELIPWNALSNYMKPAVGLFELSYFGRREIDRGAFEGLWSRITTVEEMLAQIRAGKISEDTSVSLYANSLPASALMGQAEVGGTR